MPGANDNLTKAGWTPEILRSEQFRSIYILNVKRCGTCVGPVDGCATAVHNMPTYHQKTPNAGIGIFNSSPWTTTTRTS